MSRYLSLTPRISRLLMASQPPWRPRDALPLCPRCNSGMTVRIAKQGFNAGGEFWGCSNFPSCRGTAPVPRHDWDWYQLVPLPVRITTNQQRRLDDLASNDPFLNPWIKYYESTEGFFGPYADYDEHTWAFEDATKTAELHYDAIAEEMHELERPTLQAIDQTLNSTKPDSSMAERAITAVDRYIHSEPSIRKFGEWITEKFNGSRPSMVGPDDGGIDGGFVALDDGSQLMFHRSSEGILMTEWKTIGRGLSALRHTNLLPQFQNTTAKLSMNQFEYIAGYFSRHFGLQAPTDVPWSV